MSRNESYIIRTLHDIPKKDNTDFGDKSLAVSFKLMWTFLVQCSKNLDIPGMNGAYRFL